MLSQPNTATAFLAQLDELSFLPKTVDIQMLLSDQTLNILSFFKVDDEGIPQWLVQRDKGDLVQSVDGWLLKNREEAQKSKKKKRHKSKRQKSKRKVNSMRTTFEEEAEEQRLREEADTVGDGVGSKKKEKDRDRERAERRKRKKERKKKKKKKRKKEKDRKHDDGAQSVL